MKHQEYFKCAIEHAFSELPQGFVFGENKKREKYLTDFMKKDWQRPNGFGKESLVVGKHLGGREVDFARKSDGRVVASCELKIYPLNQSLMSNGKPFTAVSEAILKQMIRCAEGIDASAFVAIAVRTDESGDETAATKQFKSIFIDNIHAHLRVKCSGLSTAVLGKHRLFMWEVSPDRCGAA